MDILEKIVAEKRKEVAAARKRRPLASFTTSLRKSTVTPLATLFPKGKINIIGEVKRKAPSFGNFPKRSLLSLAKVYEKSGCVAISVLTDKKFFGGSLRDLEEIKTQVRIPVLRKDFIIDEYQVYESRAYGADVVLLIARLLSKEKVDRYLTLARALGMHALVEVHTQHELEKVLRTRAKLIGINNRDLRSLHTSLETTSMLAKVIPKSKIIIAESGTQSRKDILSLQPYVDGFLIGTSILKSKDPRKKVLSFFHNAN